MSAQPSVAAANLAAAHNMMAALAAQPVRHVVVCPGSRSAPLVMALADKAGLKVHVVLDERVAGFVALGLARATKCAAVLVCTSGSAGAHWLPAVVEAHHARVPLVLITADRPAELQHLGAAQTTDQHNFFGSHLRGRWLLPAPIVCDANAQQVARVWSTYTAQALQAAQGSNPGPVHLNAPFREPLIPTPGAAATLQTPSCRPVRLVQPAPPSLTLAEQNNVAQQLCSMSRGILACGPLPPHECTQDLADAVVQLAARLGWPLWLDAASGLRFLGQERNHIAYDLLLSDPRFAQQYPCHALLRLGQPLTSKKAQRWLDEHALGSTVLVDGAGQLTDPHGSAVLGVHACPLTFCRQMLEALGPAKQSLAGAPWREVWQKASARLVGPLAQLKAPTRQGTQPTSRRPWEGEALAVAVAALPHDTLVHVGSSLAVRDMDSFVVQHPVKLEVSANRGVNGIDGVLATTVGLALAQPAGGPAVVGIVGDLTFLHDVAALQAARQLEVNCTIVVINNGGGGIFYQLPIAAHQNIFDTFFLTQQKADLGAFVCAAGAKHVHVKTSQRLALAVAEATAFAGPVGVKIIEVACADDAKDLRAKFIQGQI